MFFTFDYQFSRIHMLRPIEHIPIECTKFKWKLFWPKRMDMVSKHKRLPRRKMQHYCILKWFISVDDKSFVSVWIHWAKASTLSSKMFSVAFCTSPPLKITYERMETKTITTPNNLARSCFLLVRKKKHFFLLYQINHRTICMLFSFWHERFHYSRLFSLCVRQRLMYLYLYQEWSK